MVQPHLPTSTVAVVLPPSRSHALTPSRPPSRSRPLAIFAPPHRTPQQVRVGASDCFDDAVRYVFPFWVTNARSQVSLSVHPGNVAAVSKARAAGLEEILALEDDAGFEAAVQHRKPYNVVRTAPSAPAALPLVGQFVSTLMCVGHVKSTASDDTAFYDEFTHSGKWLAMRK